MPSHEMLVLMIGDAGLRSALTARLSLDRRTLITLYGDADAATLDRIVGDPITLIIDGETFARRFAALDRCLRWTRVFVLANDAHPAHADPRIRTLDPTPGLSVIRVALGPAPVSAGV